MIEYKVLKNEGEVSRESDFVTQIAKIYSTKAENLPYLDYFLTNFFKPHKKNFMVIAKDNEKIWTSGFNPQYQYFMCYENKI